MSEEIDILILKNYRKGRANIYGLTLHGWRWITTNMVYTLDDGVFSVNIDVAEELKDTILREASWLKVEVR